MNKGLLKLICKKLNAEMIIGRSVLATQLALCSGVKKVIYDGRGAIAHEWKEYKVISDPKMLNEISQLEKECILKSNFRIAVSEAMIKFWGQEYQYTNEQHAVIPCTLNADFEKTIITEENINKTRTKIGLKNDDVVYVYSGSMAGWQSIQMMEQFVRKVLTENAKAKIIFLTQASEKIEALKEEFNGRIFCFTLNPNEVSEMLIGADYGLLIREQSITNMVASPVKFAEYLACGLKVIISENLGDYSAFVRNNSAGYLFNDQDVTHSKIELNEKQRLRLLALKHFSKKEYNDQYRQVLKLAKN